MKRIDFQFLPNRPGLMGELRPEFADLLREPCGEPSMDAPESIARGSAIATLSDTGRVLTQGHCMRLGWRARCER